ncbi:MAG TPA: proton-conducting transporter membrane subunit [Dermatophilaceae bacterium]|nr:proton-conducting transporter membrane subunit [Dermatophilaceae bacterium]
MTGDAVLDWSVRLLVLAPFAAAVAGLLVARHRSASRVVAVGAALVTLAAAAYQLYAVHHDQVTPAVTTVPGLALGELRVPLHLVTDDLAAVVAVAVAVVGLAIQAYTRGYLHADPRYGVFSATVSLFLAGMLLVVQSGDLVLTLVGWEVMGWCSYLLIGHDSHREAARRAAMKAFLVTRVADLAFVLGIVALAGAAGTTEIRRLLDGATGSAGLTAALVGLLVGIAGKSGLVPFHDWLPDAMEGPTPASALIHAATMVAAGTVIVARLFPLFAAAPAARLVLAVLTAVTMVYAAALAFGQSDLKRLLAYSTLSQVALMLSALAVVPVADGPGAGILHLLSHAMFKALLFLAIGWLAVLVGGTSALLLTGSARRHPAAARPLAIGFLSLAGVPPLVGFVSKEYVFQAAADGATSSAAAWVVLVAIGATIFLTAAYCTRAWLILTHLSEDEEEALYAEQEAALPAGEPTEVSLDDMLTQPIRRADLAATQVLPVLPAEGDRDDPTDDPTDVHGSVDLDARVPVGALAVLTVLGGAVVLTPLVPGIEPHLGVAGLALSVALIALAAGVVRLMTPWRGTGDALDRLPAAVRAQSSRGLGVDGLYLTAIRPVLALARLVVRADDRVIDAYVRGAVVATRWAGLGGDRAHTRKPSTYLAWLLLGVLAVGVAGVGLW